jgi:hypothetical protein
VHRDLDLNFLGNKKDLEREVSQSVAIAKSGFVDLGSGVRKGLNRRDKANPSFPGFTFPSHSLKQCGKRVE